MMLAAGGRRRLDWGRAATALAVACALVGLGRWIASPPEPPVGAQRPFARPRGEPQFMGALPSAVTPRQGSVTRNYWPTLGVPDLAAAVPDLKRVFDENRGSSDPRQRRLAARAFDACVPAFLPAPGETPSPEPLIRALPPDRRAEREAAYRLLYARCASFLRESRESLIDLQQQLQTGAELQEPGLRAQDALIVGRYERIEPLVSRALSSDDPAGVASLAGLAVRLAMLRNAESPDPDLIQRARAVDTALPWVACDLGLDCGANSIGALQLCAAQGMCGGDMLSRLMNQAVADGVDDAEVRAQRARLLSLIQSGSAMGAADLLP